MSNSWRCGTIARNRSSNYNINPAHPMKVASRLLVFACLIAGTPAIAGVNSWTVGGPPGGDTRSIAFHPTRPSIALAQARGGIHRSTDGGATWTWPANPVGANGLIAFDPTQPDRVYLASLDFYRSTDAGVTFTRLPFSGFQTSGRHDFKIAGDGVLYVAGYDGRVFRSTDQGDQWTDLPVAWVTPSNNLFPVLGIDPNEPNRIYAAIQGQGIYRSEDRGATWIAPVANAPGSVGVNSGQVWSIAVKPGDSNRLLAAGAGLFSSQDRGATWTRHRFSPGYSWVAFDPSQPTNAVAVTNSGGVARSTDSGDTWPPALEGASRRLLYFERGAFVPGTPGHLMLATIDGPILSTDGGATFSTRFTGLHGGAVSWFASADDGTLYSLYEFGPMGVYRRSGGNWLPVNNDALRAAIPTAPQPIHFATAATDSSLLYVISSNSQLVRSIDGGATWSAPATEFLPQLYPQYVEVDPSNADVAFVSTYNDGLWKTTNRGVTWTKRSTGLPSRVESIGIDPANTDVIYVSTFETPTNIFKSTNGGASWAPSGTMRPGNVRTFAFDPSNTNIIYAGSGADVIKTTDAGANWTQINFGGPTGVYTRAMAVLVDPVIPSTVFVVSSPNEPGFMRSVDSGVSWERFLLQVPQLDVLFLDAGALDPLVPNRLHVGVHGVGILEYEVATDLDVSLLGFDEPLPILGSRAVRVRARNGSQFASSASVVRVVLPGFLATNVPAGCSLAAAVLTCNAGVLPGLGTQDFEFTVTAGAVPTLGEVTASIQGHETDPDNTNNTARVSAESRLRTDMGVITLPSRTLGRSATATHNVIVGNNGPDAALNSRLVMTFSPGTTALSATSGIGACAVAGATVTCTLGTLAPAASTTVDVTMRADAVGAASIISYASSDGIDTNTDQSATTNVTIQPLSDTAVELAVAAGAKVAGTPFQYTATVRNNGPDPARIEALFTAMNSGATVTTATTAGGNCAAPASDRVTCTLSELASGGSTTITFTVNAALAGTVEATVLVLYRDSVDSSPLNNGDQELTPVSAPPPPPVSGSSSGGGGSKGGGRFDWLAVFLLAVLAWRRFHLVTQPRSAWKPS